MRKYRCPFEVPLRRNTDGKNLGIHKLYGIYDICESSISLENCYSHTNGCLKCVYQ